MWHRRPMLEVMRLAVLVLGLMLARPASGGHFIASLHSNFVVSLDFENKPTSATEAEDGETKVMAFAGGQQKFSCRLPGRRNATRGRSQPNVGLQDRSKFETHFRNAKLASLKGKCSAWRKDYWSYELCFGTKITQFNTDASAFNSLGEHAPNMDVLQPNGGVTEVYTGGTSNRTSHVHYICGSGGPEGRTFEIVEAEELTYNIYVSGPQFCSWKGEGVETRTEDGRTLKVSSLLEDLRGSCINMTQGWWTYEYCFPDTLRQYHLQNGKKDPVHVLGTLNGTSSPVERDKVQMTMVKTKPSASNPRERRAASSNHRSLRQYLGGGAVCDETGQARSATVQFQCPSGWETRSETRFDSIKEGQLCEYEVVVQSTLLCGHRKLVPTLPKGNEVLQCVVEPEA